jgi:zinc protease
MISLRNTTHMTIARTSLALAAALLPLTAAAQTAAKAPVKPAGSVTPAAAQQSPTAQPWTKIPIPPLHPFKPAQPKRIELSNGLVIFLQEDHELPFVDGTILIRGGSREVPSDKVGLVSLYGESWRTSGSTTKPGDALDNELAAKAASIETSGGTATTSLNWGSFKQDFDTVFGEAVDLLLHPDFKADKLAIAKRQIDTAISRRNDNPDAIAVREATKIVYGPTNPYGRQPEYTTVEAVTLDDLKSWHDRTVAPNNMIVAVGGDFDSAEMEQKLRKAFEPMQRGVTISPLKVDFPGPKPGVYYAEKNDVNQSTVEIVGLGTERNNPDFYALTVMNEIFSGGFGSRVVQSVRTRLGLAYDVGGSFGATYDHPGVFRSEAGTKSSTTVDAAKAVLDEISKLKSVPPTESEMRKAKDQVMNSFIFNYDTPAKILNEQVVLAFYGYPPDYLEKFRAGIERVTAADVTRVANKYIDVSKLAVVVVGNKADIQPPLSALGPVTNLDITIPPPPAGVGRPATRNGNPGASTK